MNGWEARTTRRSIWFKDDYFPVGSKRVEMDPSIVVLPSGMVALTWQFDYNEDSILGHVDDIRFEDGEITGEVNLLDSEKGRSVHDFLEHGEVRLGGFYSDVTQKDDVILTATLRSVGVVLTWGAANPGAKVKL